MKKLVRKEKNEALETLREMWDKLSYDIELHDRPTVDFPGGKLVEITIDDKPFVGFSHTQGQRNWEFQVVFPVTVDSEPRYLPVRISASKDSLYSQLVNRIGDDEFPVTVSIVGVGTPIRRYAVTE